MKTAIQRAIYALSFLSLFVIAFVPAADAKVYRHYRYARHYHHHSLVGSAINLAGRLGTTYMRYRMAPRYYGNPYMGGGYGYNPYFSPSPYYGYNPYGYRPW